MKLSEHFTLNEMELSSTAIRRGFNNKADGDAQSNLKDLCVNVLEPVRLRICQVSCRDIPLHINSGYRGLEINRLIGSSDGSQHTRGQAADITSSYMSAQAIALMIERSNIKYDQLIYEGRWVHVSFKEMNRMEKLTATFRNGEVFYSTGITS